MKKLTQYLNLLPQCVLNYQFIEEGLRFCLFTQHAIVARRLKNILPYQPPVESIRKAAMGKLINYFQTFSDNKDLMTNLYDVKKKRDQLVHQGYILSFEEQNNPQYISEQLNELESAYREAKECFLALQGEMKRFHDLEKSIAKES